MPFWRDLTVDQQGVLQFTMIERRFRLGTTIQSDSEDCPGLLVVTAGQLRVFLISPTGKEITLYRVFGGEICLFSASCIIRGANFDVYVQTERETTALVIPTSVYQELMDQSTCVANFTNMLMASRLTNVIQLMEDVLFSSFDSRLAAFLLEQSAIERSATLRMTHEQIARNLGTAREVVSRMLGYFQTEGLIVMSRGCITITNGPKLRALVQ